MVMRNWLCEPDKPETGGYILPNPAVTVTVGNNIRAALIGSKAYCEACKSIGMIAKAGGPRRMNFMGEIALDHDILLCKCPKPPRMIATSTSTHQYDDMAQGAGIAPSATAAVSTLLTSAGAVIPPQKSIS
ncbi:PAAR domain-containing protein [Collimonas pratensis]|uniref:PAAR domain-containing protein n=1 Tax=Collimonas pratensis TaxID=279113 RepID=UPI0007864197|nr:PAAR domain-containing protein [Collimonas pratensis]